MSTMAEIQTVAGRRSGNILPGHSGFPAAVHAAEEAWGGPLPGRVRGVQHHPLRCEIAGRPPVRLLRATSLPLDCAHVAQYWQLRPAVRVAGVYHWRLDWTPMPALPAGLSLPGGPHPCARLTLGWDTGEVLGWRLYVHEWAVGAVHATWPELTTADDAEPAHDRAYGLDYGADLVVTGISRYDYPVDSMDPAELEHSALRRALAR